MLELLKLMLMIVFLVDRTCWGITFHFYHHTHIFLCRQLYQMNTLPLFVQNSIFLHLIPRAVLLDLDAQQIAQYNWSVTHSEYMHAFACSVSFSYALFCVSASSNHEIKKFFKLTITIYFFAGSIPLCPKWLIWREWTHSAKHGHPCRQLGHNATAGPSTHPVQQ